MNFWIPVNPVVRFKYIKMHYVDKNGVDPDQLASSEASWSGSTLFSKEIIDFCKRYAHSGLTMLNMVDHMIYGQTAVYMADYCNERVVVFTREEFLMLLKIDFVTK